MERMKQSWSVPVLFLALWLMHQAAPPAAATSIATIGTLALNNLGTEQVPTDPKDAANDAVTSQTSVPVPAPPPAGSAGAVSPGGPSSGGGAGGGGSGGGGGGGGGSGGGGSASSATPMGSTSAGKPSEIVVTQVTVPVATPGALPPGAFSPGNSAPPPLGSLAPGSLPTSGDDDHHNPTSNSPGDNPTSNSPGGGGTPQAAATPEPASLTLLVLSGLGGLAYARRPGSRERPA
jgi:hypothetical protein